MKYISPKDQIEIYIDGCDNYEFQIPDLTYIFARKRSQKNKIETYVLPLLESQRMLTYVIAGDNLCSIGYCQGESGSSYV